MPVAVFVLAILMLITIVTAYGRYGKGVEFFTGVEPSQTQIQVFARGNFSPAEVRDLYSMWRAYRRVGHIKGIVTQSGAGAQMGGDQQTALI